METWCCWKCLHFFLPHVVFGSACSCILLYDWHPWEYFYLIDKTCLLRHGNKFLLLCSSRFASIQDLQDVFWSYKPLDWVISDIRGWAQLCTSKSPVSCARGGLCCWGMHVKRHWRPLNSRLLIHCHIMDHLGQKEPEKMMHVLKFTTFQEMCGTDPGQ